MPVDLDWFRSIGVDLSIRKGNECAFEKENEQIESVIGKWKWATTSQQEQDRQAKNRIGPISESDD